MPSSARECQATTEAVHRLIFDEPIPGLLLRFVVRMSASTLRPSYFHLVSDVDTVVLSTRKLDSRLIAWNRLILLYGPPGTGKTSIWQA